MSENSLNVSFPNFFLHSTNKEGEKEALDKTHPGQEKIACNSFIVTTQVV